MANDPNLILQAMRSQVQFDPIGSYEAGQRARSNQMLIDQRRREEALKQKEYEDAMMARDVFSRHVGPDGQINMSGALSDLGRLGRGDLAQKIGMDWQKQQATIAQTAAQTENYKATTAKTRDEKRRNDLMLVSNAASAALDAARQAGDIRAGEQVWQSALNTLAANEVDITQYPSNFDPRAMAGLAGLGVGAKDRLSADRPQSEVAKIDADFKSGRISKEERDAAVKNATTKGPGITLGLMAPQAGVDLRTGEPVFFQPSKSGGPAEIIPNVAPAEKTAKLPQAVVQNFIENEQQLGNILKTIKAVQTEEKQGDRSSLGLKNLAPDAIIQRMDPAGVPVRASLAQIKSMRFKDMSGAAVSVAEDKRLSRYIPDPTDDPKVVEAKLGAMAKEIANIQRGYATAYSDGYKPIPQFEKYLKGGKQGQQGGQPRQGGIVSINSDEEWERLPKGTRFRGPDGKERVK